MSEAGASYTHGAAIVVPSAEVAVTATPIVPEKSTGTPKVTMPASAGVPVWAVPTMGAVTPVMSVPAFGRKISECHLDQKTKRAGRAVI